MERYAEEVMSPLSLNNATKNDLSVVIKSFSFSDIAAKLLNEKLLLTALELHAELTETGRELPILRDFFANSQNFENATIKPTSESYGSMPRSSSQATLDSLDMTRFSEDGGGVDERVAVLEFELRKAKENILALRENLTVIVESEGTSPNKNISKERAEDDPIKPHEQKALNFLVYEYLLSQSYKLTSITFSDENENQDFEDWEDVGLNIPKLPNLLQIFREFFRRNGYDRPSFVESSTQTEPLETSRASSAVEIPEFDELTEINELKHRITVLEGEKLNLERRFEESEPKSTLEDGPKLQINSTQSNSTTPDKFEMVESPQGASHDADDDSISAGLSLGETDPGDKEWMRIQLPKVDITLPAFDAVSSQPSRSLPAQFKHQILACAEINPADCSSVDSEMFVESADALVEQLATSLPVIAPNIILNKRDEIIVLLLNTIRLHPTAGTRDKLLELLFNLKKKPQKEERQTLLRALVMASRAANRPLDAEEILTACWEQSQHRYTERRLLAVECCSALAPHASSATRNSLVVSMLQQMLLDEKDQAVRIAVIRSITLLVALTDDPDKYFQFEELAIAALDDISSHVSEMAASILLPTLAEWALALHRLFSHLLPRVVAKLKLCLQHLPNKDHASSEKAVTLLSVLQILAPHTVVCVVNNCPGKPNASSELPRNFLTLITSNLNDPRVFLNDSSDFTRRYNSFLSEQSLKTTSWPELDWLREKLLPDILDMVKIINLTQEKVLDALLEYIQTLLNGFLHPVIQAQVKSHFQAQVHELEQFLLTENSQAGLSLSLIPAYLRILVSQDHSEFIDCLKRFIIVFATNLANLTTIVRLLCKPGAIEPMLTAMWSGVVHQRIIVRCATARLFGEIVKSVDESLVMSRVTPAIITLASDSDLTVKGAAIVALGKLITDCDAKQVQDKARFTLESIVREAHGIPQALAVPLISTFAAMASICPQHYVEDIIATQLTGITASTLQQTPNNDLAIVLLEAYSTLVYCPLSDDCIAGVVLPGLGYLESLVNDSLPHYRENVRSLIREAEMRQSRPKSTEKSFSSTAGLSLNLSTVNVGQGVEDMRQRVTKIFTPKSNSPGMASLFRKKG